MTSRITEQPRAVLVDDDIHSARLLVRTLTRLGGPTLKWYGRPERSLGLLVNDFAGPRPRPPQAIVVDLKGNSAATATFIRRLRERLPALTMPVVALAPDQDAPIHEAILAAGAMAVFARGADAAAYRSEVARLAAFLAPRAFYRPQRTIITDAAATTVGLDVDHEIEASDDDASGRQLKAHAANTAVDSGLVLDGPPIFDVAGRPAQGGYAGESEPFLIWSALRKAG